MHAFAGDPALLGLQEHKLLPAPSGLEMGMRLPLRVSECLQNSLQSSLLSGIHSLELSPPILYQVCFVGPIACSRRDGVSLLGLGY